MNHIEKSGPVLAVDWGAKRLGIAISDLTHTLARPLTILNAKSRRENSVDIAAIARKHHCTSVVVGASYDDFGELTPSGRRAKRLADALDATLDANVLIFDESHSTRRAKQNQISLGSSRKKRKGHLDAKAAAVFLQSYLDEQLQDEKL